MVKIKRRLHSTSAMARRNDCNFTIAAIQTVDALAEALVGDAAGILPSSSPRFPQTGERRLIRDLINGALAEAAATPRNKQEAEALADARAWLRNELAAMSARYCFEVLGIDYDAAIEKLEKAWKVEAEQ